MYRPTIGSTVDNIEKAIPWGMCITATVTPAVMSPTRLSLNEYLGSHFKTGIILYKADRTLKVLILCQSS
jgi:hypothetical protein